MFEIDSDTRQVLEGIFHDLGQVRGQDATDSFSLRQIHERLLVLLDGDPGLPQAKEQPRPVADGGPAFPRPYSEDKWNEDQLPSQRGMSLRAYIATHALQGVLSAGSGGERAVRDAMFVVDILLAELEKPRG